MRVHFETPLVSQKMANPVLSILFLIQKILHSMWVIFQIYEPFWAWLFQSWAWAQHHICFGNRSSLSEAAQHSSLRQDLMFISLPTATDHGKQSQPFSVQIHLKRIRCIRSSRCEIFLFHIPVPMQGERWDSGWGSIQDYCSIGLQENMDDKQQLDGGTVP